MNPQPQPKTRRRALIAASLVMMAVGALLLLRPPPQAPAPDTPASAMTVALTAPDRRDWPQVLTGSGPIAPWQEIVVSPETGGLRVAELLVDVGAVVRRGQVLARLADDSLQVELRKQQAVVAQARSSLEQASAYVRRADAVGANGALSDQQIEEYRISEATARATLQSSQADLDSVQLKLAQTRVLAPDDGVVSSKTGIVGNVASAGTELLRLVRQGRLEWRPELDAHAIASVQAGQKAALTLPGGERTTGTVRIAAPTLSTATGRATVYVSLNGSSTARAGMFASGQIELGSTPALTLPQSAIVMRDGRAYVYLVDADDKVAAQAVTTGRRQDDRVELLSQLPGDARVVASGGAFLSDGVQVTVARQEAVR
jgi:RND family efflux transporter MFP subunit